MTISPSPIREGYVEFRFPEKPDEEIRTALKAARYRWAKTSRCWYGPEENLPNCIRPNAGA